MKNRFLATIMFVSFIFFGMTSCKKLTEETVCNPPEGIVVSEVRNTTAKFTWSSTQDAQQYVLRYRKIGNTKFTEQRPKTNEVTVTDLAPATEYEWQIQSNCSGSNSSFTDLAVFKTMTNRQDAIQRRWKFNSWTQNGVALALESADFAEFKKDGAYEQKLIGISNSGSWQFNNTAEDELRITTTAERNYKILNLTTSQLRLAGMGNPSQDTIVMIPE
jgi:hypothetical protein